MAVTYPKRVQELVTTTIPSTRYTPASRTKRDIRVIVPHLAITAETSTAAEAVARYFQSGVRASSHFSVDNDSIVGQVRLDDVAWAAPGCNHDGIQIEQAGRLQTPAQWGDDYSVAMLHNTAKLTAALCHELDIPPVRLSDAELRAGKRGIADHWAVTRVYKQSDHTDCGTHFPWDFFMGLVRGYYDGAPVSTSSKPQPTTRPAGLLRRGDFGPAVAEVQERLRIPADGIFGSQTEVAVRAFQRSKGLAVDGIVGPNTLAALAKATTPKKQPVKTVVKTAVLRVGSRGAAVKRLQAGLNKAFPAYSRLKVDGIYGPSTANTVRTFQRRSGLAADGVVGPRTRKALAKHEIRP